MSEPKKLYQVEKNADDVRRTILTNIIKMLTARKLLPAADQQKNIQSVLEAVSDDMTYLVDLGNKEKVAIKIVSQKITAINRSFGINEFLIAYKNNHKIVVVKEISKKAVQYIMNNFSDTEIFLEEELMINIIDNDIIPIHELLTEEEQQTFLVDYNCKKKNMPKILNTDPVARYYNMKPGNICRILRPSEKAGLCPTYRLVIKGSLK